MIETPYNLGGGLINSKQAQVQPNQDLAQQFQDLQNFVLDRDNKAVKNFSFE